METYNFKTYSETAPFVEALRTILQAEDKTLEGFSQIYGNSDATYQESGLPEAFDNLKNLLKVWIGTTFELGITGCLGGGE